MLVTTSSLGLVAAGFGGTRCPVVLFWAFRLTPPLTNTRDIPELTGMSSEVQQRAFRQALKTARRGWRMLLPWLLICALFAVTVGPLGFGPQSSRPVLYVRIVVACVGMLLGCFFARRLEARLIRSIIKNQIAP